MPDNPDRVELVKILQRAYSGELAAALAYNGHWKSVSDPFEKETIRQIELDELRHRECVAGMLASLDAAPRRGLEIRCRLVGLVAAAGCRVSGWFMPMYLAGLLETSNVSEYERAASCADRLGLMEFARELRAMGRTEKEHEAFFQNTYANHRLLPLALRLIPGKALKSKPAANSSPSVPSIKQTAAPTLAAEED
jgi:hypothetical protein